MSNLVFKAGAAGMLGNRRLLWYVALLFGIAFAAGGALLLFWPNIEIALPALPSAASGAEK